MTVAERETLRAQLGGLGFDEVRFSSAAHTPDAGFRNWLAAGHHADMHWLERTADKRLDIQTVLPGAKSLVALGVNYLPSGAAAVQERWSKYALYRDYHDTIGGALEAARALILASHGENSGDARAYVDTGPLLERGWAAAAGIGWQGKNAMLISRKHGNWLFLAAVVTTIEIPPDPLLPAVDANPEKTVGQYCGSCTRCLSACPTDAFAEPGRVDARRCIAYHTIENRGIIPRELRAAFGGRVFGCDTCLDVCPWNRFAQAGRSALLVAKEEIAGLSLLDLLGMDERRFREVFRQTAIKRGKLAGLLRNACIAAGNWDTSTDWRRDGIAREAVVAAVERLCAHESPIVRPHAVWALHRLLGKSQAQDRLAAARAAEQSSAVIEEYLAWDD